LIDVSLLHTGDPVGLFGDSLGGLAWAGRGWGS
jgi:hypothetical protein